MPGLGVPAYLEALAGDVFGGEQLQIHPFVGSAAPGLDLFFDQAEAVAPGVVLVAEPGVGFGVGAHRIGGAGAACLVRMVLQFRPDYLGLSGPLSRLPAATGRDVSPRTSSRFPAASSSLVGVEFDYPIAHGFEAFVRLLFGEGERDNQTGRTVAPAQLLMQGTNRLVPDAVFAGATGRDSLR